MKPTAITTTREANKGFYPTPPDLAEKLLAGIDWTMIETVLEPSAGKGDLVWAIARAHKIHGFRSYRDFRLDVDLVEIDPHLRSVLSYEWGDQREGDINVRLAELNEKRTYDPEQHKYRELPAADKQEEKELKAERETRLSISANVVHDDFLTFPSRKSYNLIVMNPPFADGDAHLLKALEIAERSGGEVRCILNAETLLNPYTNRRKVLAQKLQELGAEVSYITGAFKGAERETDVTVAVIKAKVPAVEHKSYIYERLKKAAAYEETAEDVSSLALEDFLANIVSRFNLEVDAGLALIDEYNAMRPYLLEDAAEGVKYNYPIITLSIGGKSRLDRSERPSKNAFVREVRKKYWRALFTNDQFMARMTSNIREKYTDMVGKMIDYDFTLFNIQQIITEMNAELNQGIQDTIVALFDKMTEQHSWYPEMSKNIHYFNGWATNKVHKINSKVILPTYGMFSSNSWSKETFNLRQAEDTISDIEKVFSYLDGDMTAEVDLHGVLKAAWDAGQTKNIQCRYFSVTLYKKGTMHIKFHKQDLVDRFNIYCCKHKNWLPPSYGKRKYEDMPAAEQAVVDEFQGREAYENIMQRADYFLAPVSSGEPLLAICG